MGRRRDDIFSQRRAQIAIEVLAVDRAYGDVSRLAAECGVSRQTIYTIKEAGRRVLETYLSPGPMALGLAGARFG